MTDVEVIQSGHFGLSWVWKVGMVFRSFLPISNCAGEYPVGKSVERWLTICLSPFSVCSSLSRLLARLLHLTVGIRGYLGVLQIPILWQNVSAIKRRPFVGSKFFRDPVSCKYCFESSDDFGCCLVFP